MRCVGPKLSAGRGSPLDRIRHLEKEGARPKPVAPRVSLPSLQLRECLCLWCKSSSSALGPSELMIVGMILLGPDSLDADSPSFKYRQTRVQRPPHLPLYVMLRSAGLDTGCHGFSGMCLGCLLCLHTALLDCGV